MSEKENVALIQAAYEAFERGAIPEILGKLHEDVEWILPGSSTGIRLMGPRRGRTEVEEVFAFLAADEEALQFEPQRFVAQGDMVVVFGHYKWRIRATGIVAESDFVHAYTLSGDAVVRFQEYTDTAAFVEAYRAAPASG
jgi:uncharacterized protein